MHEYKILPLLFGLTFIAGLVDAVTFLKLGEVFVANMTGNVVLLGLGIGGAKEISIGGSFVAIAAFMVGALTGGRLSRRAGESGAHLLLVTTIVEIVLMLAAAAAAYVFGTGGLSGYAIIAALAALMGLQNASVRSLGIADITTTVITTIMAGIAADSTPAGGTNTRVRRRLGSVLLMFGGALIGAMLVFTFGVSPTLAAAALTLAVLSLWAWRLRSATQP